MKIKVLELAIFYHMGEITVQYGRTQEEAMESLFDDIYEEDDLEEGETKEDYLHRIADEYDVIFQLQTMFIGEEFFNTLNTWEGFDE